MSTPGRSRFGLMGKRKPPNSVTLWVKCPQCDGSVILVDDTNHARDCLCGCGFVETPLTEARFDQLAKDNDNLLVLLASLKDELLPPDAARSVRVALKGREADIEAARSRIA